MSLLSSRRSWRPCVCVSPVHAQNVEPGRTGLRQPLRRVPRHGRRGRRAGPVHRGAHSAAQRRGSRSGDPRRAAGRRHAGVRQPLGDRERGPHRLPADAASARRLGAAADDGHAHDRRLTPGIVLNQSAGEMQLLGDDRRVHLLRRRRGGRYREVTSQADWTTYNGQPNGNRYSALTQITAGNVVEARAAVDLHAAQRVAAAGDAGRRRTA